MAVMPESIIITILIILPALFILNKLINRKYLNDLVDERYHQLKLWWNNHDAKLQKLEFTVNNIQINTKNNESLIKTIAELEESIKSLDLQIKSLNKRVDGINISQLV